MRRAIFIGVAFVVLLAGAEPAKRLVYSGAIGQTVDDGSTNAIPWTSCSWCVTDARGDVHFPGGWKVRKGARAVTRERNTVPGYIFSDGAGELFYFYDRRAELGTVEATAEGLSPKRQLARLYHWDLTLHAAPSGCTTGFAAGGRRFFALDRRTRTVHAWTREGADAGVVFSFADRKEPFVSLAIEPTRGDLLLGDPWPACRVHRFRADGTEVTNAFWPYPGHALTLKNVGKETWILGGGASRITESLAPGARLNLSQLSTTTYDIAATAEGWYIATSQGAQYFARHNSGRCARRVGGLANVTAMAAHGGRLVVCDGYRILLLWADDVGGDIISSDGSSTVARRWDEMVDRIEVRDGVFYLNESKHGRVIAFDPRITEWVFREKRQHDVTGVTVTGDNRRTRLDERHVAVAADEGIQLLRDGACVQTLPVKATCLAADGDWLFAYVPARKAILRWKLTD